MPRFTVAEAAILLCVSQPTISGWIQKGYLRPSGAKRGGRDLYGFDALLRARLHAQAASVAASGIYVPRRPRKSAQMPPPR